jgi:septal ring factor EnvC (AmiA/AmiB activator)
MKTIKKYWVLIVAAVAGVIASIFIKKYNAKKLDKIDDEIKQNDADINILQGRIEEVESQREHVIEEVQQHQTRIEDLREQLTEVKPEVLDVADAKQNILNKTKRGRKPKNKTT